MIAVLLISLLFTIVFVVGLKSRGPWGSGWTFFTIVCLWLAAVSLWIPPAGPVWLGAPWIDLFVTGLLVSFVLSATSIDSSSTHYLHEDAERKDEKSERHNKAANSNKSNYAHKSNYANREVKNKKTTNETTAAGKDLIQTSLSPPTSMHSSLVHEPFDGNLQALRAGGFFWMLLLCLCALIIIGAQ